MIIVALFNSNKPSKIDLKSNNTDISIPTGYTFLTDTTSIDHANLSKDITETVDLISDITSEALEIGNEINTSNEIKESLKGSRVKKGDYCDYYYDENNELIGIMYKNNIYAYYSDGKYIYKRYDPKTDTYKNISIFDEENDQFGQYGANQGVFEYNFDDLINHSMIWDEMQKYYPLDSFDSVDEAMDFYERYFQVICDTGCGYAAATNIIFMEYEGREDEFYETFGFPMYGINREKGAIVFNYPAMMLKYFNYCWAGKYSIEEMEKGVDIADNIEDFFRTDAVSTAADLRNFDDFLRDEYGIECTSDTDKVNQFTHFSSDEKILNKFNEQLNENDYLVYSGDNWDLYTMDGELYTESGGGHYLIILGSTEDGQLIVSSWGNKYIVDVKGKKNGRYRLTKVNF